MKTLPALLLLIVTGSAVSPAGAQNAQFLYSRAAYPNFTSTTIGLGDFKTDGEIDIVTTPPFSFSVRPGKGDGSFLQPINTTINYSCVDSLIVADFNRDGHQDVACRFSNAFEFAFGIGDGTFQTPHVVNLSGISLLNKGDFNGDGIVDLVAQAGSTLYFYYGKADGSFAAPLDLPLLTGSFTQIRPVDMNNDGNDDLLGTRDNKVIVVYGLSATLPPVSLTLPVDTVDSIAAGDLDNDGLNDIVVTVNRVASNFPITHLVTLHHNSNGSYTPTLYATPNPLTAPQVADLNNDGFVDVSATSLPDAILFQTFLNNGSGGLNAPVTYSVPVDVYKIANPRHRAVPDVILSDGNTIQLLPNRGDGHFFPGIQVNAGDPGTTCKLGNLNTDKLHDLICLDLYKISTWYRTANVKQPYAAGQTLSLIGPASAIDSADFDNDGLGDIVAALADSTIQFIHNNGTTFTQESVRSLSGPLPSGINAGDFDGDGNVDLVTTAGFFLKGNGDGTFQAPKQFYTGGVFKSFTLADLNGDGKLDLIGNSGTDTPPVILLGNGAGGFTSSSLAGVSSVYPPAVIDANGDGYPDLAFPQGSSGISIYIGRGDGSFYQFSTVRSDFIPPIVSVTPGSFNGDGFADLIFGMDDYTVWLAAGKGDGTFDIVGPGFGAPDVASLLTDRIPTSSGPKQLVLAGSTVITVLQSAK